MSVVSPIQLVFMAFRFLHPVGKNEEVSRKERQ